MSNSDFGGVHIASRGCRLAVEMGNASLRTVTFFTFNE